VQQQQQDEAGEDSGEDEYLDDPMGLNKLARLWKPTVIGSSRSTIDPDNVADGDFVIIRAKDYDEDSSSFKIGDIDIPLWLCKASRHGRAGVACCKRHLTTSFSRSPHLVV
jgi:hypothetical protein